MREIEKKVLLFTDVWPGTTKLSRDEICCYGNRARLKKSFKQWRLDRAIWLFSIVPELSADADVDPSMLLMRGYFYTRMQFAVY